jgi:hypothetical protein
MVLEAGKTYLVVPFSVTAAVEGASGASSRHQRNGDPPAVLRLYGGSRQRSRPAKASLIEVKTWKRRSST